ncbi:EF hand [Sphingomonas laterariae]|uniref:EF hand n=1 Tax=Edaphosphingomonas laterariae TaxID=861865 RepID=A0A239JXS1_9SPHN|nr:calcium-binding protein [Sphingomonas laterariae]SNT10777.1 EF hand [Sphingomonas laterariae]
MKKLAIGASLAALIAVPALAFQAAAPDRPAPPPQTRTAVEASVKDHFAKMDLNKDGAVTQQEIQAGRDARMKQRADERFAALDTDKNGQISRAEFDAGRDRKRDGWAERGGPGGKHHGMRGHHRGGGDHMGGRMFGMADADKDGKVTLAEATTARLQWFDKIDANKDGTISPEERQAARAQMRQAKAPQN